MRITVARPGELGPDDIASWRSMQSSTPSLANPFLSPEFAVEVGKHRPSARVAVLSDGPSTVGFFPFERGRFGAGRPIAPGLTDCQGVIHAPGVQWDARELLQACRLAIWQFDHLVDGQGPFERYRASIRPSPVIDVSGGFDSYREKLGTRSPQFCRNVERKARKLGREVGELRFVADSDDVSAFRALIAWKTLQYQRTGQVNVFARPWVAALTEALFRTRTSHFSGLLSVLYAGEVPIAAHFGMRCSHVLAHWFPAYDLRFSSYSAGLIMHMRMAEFTPDAGVQVIDLGTGVQRYKEELKSSDIFVGAGIVSRKSVLAAAHRARATGGQWAVNATKQTPFLSGTARWMRNRYRLARGSRSPSSPPSLPGGAGSAADPNTYE